MTIEPEQKYTYALCIEWGNEEESFRLRYLAYMGLGEWGEMDAREHPGVLSDISLTLDTGVTVLLRELIEARIDWK